MSDIVYIRWLKTMNLPFPFYTIHQTINKVTLVDSRVTENFLDKPAWKGLQIRHIRLPQPLIIYNVDGTEN